MSFCVRREFCRACSRVSGGYALGGINVKMGSQGPHKLVQFAKTRGLSTTGTKDALCSRLLPKASASRPPPAVLPPAVLPPAVLPPAVPKEVVVEVDYAGYAKLIYDRYFHESSRPAQGSHQDSQGVHLLRRAQGLPHEPFLQGLRRGYQNVHGLGLLEVDAPVREINAPDVVNHTANSHERGCALLKVILDEIRDDRC